MNNSQQTRIDDQIYKQYTACLERLNAQTSHRLKSFWHPDILLETPLFQAEGRAASLEYYSRMLGRFKTHKMKVRDITFSHDNAKITYVRWDQMIMLESQWALSINGVSELTWHMDEDKIVHQLDIWDPTPLYEGASPIFRFGLKRARKRT